MSSNNEPSNEILSERGTSYWQALGIIAAMGAGHGLILMALVHFICR
jgi:hypothetical protein